MKRTALATVLAVLLANSSWATTALNDTPPPWRGQWSTTSQVWEFLYDSNPGGVERVYAPDGPAPGGQPPLGNTHAVVVPGNPVWMGLDTIYGSGRFGIWGLSGLIDVLVDNHEPPNEYKWVWAQLTWAPEDPVSFSSPILTNLNPAADPAWPVTVIDEIDWGDGWYTSIFEWRIYPNPPEEFFTVSYEGQPIIVDQLIVDTWCIPEPATLGLLAAGGLMFLRRRWAQLSE